MDSLDRRNFLKMMGVTASGTAGLSMLPPAIAKALAIEPNNATGTIRDVEHVVILMQENRSFDHYYGTYNGVRGYTDPRPVISPSTGKSVFNQPITNSFKGNRRGVKKGAKDVLPFHVDLEKTGENLDGSLHGVPDGFPAWNAGRWDSWISTKEDVFTMCYLKHEDISYHRHLANAFTICDHNFSSVHGDTIHNRNYQISGSLGDPASTNPSFDDRWNWTTYPERVQNYNNNPKNAEKKRLTCRTYQGGTGKDSAGINEDNFEDNNLQYFYNYMFILNDEWIYFQDGNPKHTVNGETVPYTGDLGELLPLIKDNVTNHTLVEFQNDITANKLPNISWVVAPKVYSEHAGHQKPTDGAYFINEILSALVSNKDVWSKTVFIIHYDENDGLFDHVVPPVHTTASNGGKMSPSLKDGINAELFNEMKENFKDEPVGFGPRVPMTIISPWTKGGWVCSQVFDHTSVLRFLEQRFGLEESETVDKTNTLYESNTCAWRRAITGDLTSAFDFSRSTTDYKANPQKDPFTAKPGNSTEVSVPANNTLPKAENPKKTFGEYDTSNTDFTRKARPLPYTFYVHGKFDPASKKFAMDFENHDNAVCFYVYDYQNKRGEPRRYSVAKNEPLHDTWTVSAKGYDLAVHGPNGYLCQFKGKAAAADDVHPEVEIMYQENGNVTLKLVNQGKAKCMLKITSAYTKIDAADGTAAFDIHSLGAKMCHSDFREFETKDGWYDLTIELLDASNNPDGVYLRRFAGHVETGKPSITDPFLTYQQVEA